MLNQRTIYPKQDVVPRIVLNCLVIYHAKCKLAIMHIIEVHESPTKFTYKRVAQRQNSNEVRKLPVRLRCSSMYADVEPIFGAL